MDNGLNILELLIEEDRPLSKARIQKVLEGRLLEMNILPCAQI